MDVALDLDRKKNPVGLPRPEEGAPTAVVRAEGSGPVAVPLLGSEAREPLDPNGFSASYALARERLLAAAYAYGARVHSEYIDAKGPDGETLAIDFVGVGPRDASRLVLVSSGTHGVEGFLGSAVQTRWLEGLASGRASLPDGVAVLFIHAVNPYGFAWQRRVNEDNIDLNRNFVQPHERYEGKPPKFEQVTKLLDPTRPPRRAERLPYVRMGGTILRHGFRPLKQALVTGQYEHPDTLFFGGKGPSASMRILSRVLPALAGHPERVAHIDIHSGLGPRGEFTLLLEPIYSKSRLEHLHSFFPGRRLEGAAGDDFEVTYSIRGGFLAWCAATLFSETDYRPMTAECGTQSNFRVLEALYLEHLAHSYGQPGTCEYERAKERILEAFAPSDPAWRKRASDEGIWLIDQAVSMTSADSP